MRFDLKDAAFLSNAGPEVRIDGSHQCANLEINAGREVVSAFPGPCNGV